MNWSLMKKVFLILGILVVFISGCSLSHNSPKKDSPSQSLGNEKEDNLTIKDDQQQELSKPNEEITTSEENNQDTGNKENDQPDSSQQYLEPQRDPDQSIDNQEDSHNDLTSDQTTPIESQKPSKPHISKPDNPRNPADSQKWKAIDAIAESAQQYYSNNFSMTRLISKNGYFYNKAAEFVVDTSYLANKEGLAREYRNYNCPILLIKGTDLLKFENLSISPNDADLTPFVAYYDMVKDTYLIASANSKGGTLTPSQYNQLLASYSQDHGLITNPFENSEPYNRILSFISMYESRYEDYFVRDISMDNKYAHVVLSSKSNTSDVREYILRYDNGFWEVVMKNLENEPRLVVAVNKKLPDFNINMLPSYSIHDSKAYLQTDFSEQVNQLVRDGEFRSASELYYACGTNEYAYIVRNNGARYVFYKQGDVWAYGYVNSYEEAIQYLKSLDKSSPAYIVLYH